MPNHILSLVLNVDQFPAHEGAGKLRPELIQIVCRVTQAVIVRNRMEELLCIQCAAEEESEVSVGCLDNVRDLVYSLAAIKRVLIRQSILHAILQNDPSFERFCDS